MSSWQWTQVQLDTPALLKRIRVDMEGAARGYVAVFDEEGGVSYYAGSAPHLTRYTTERAARSNAFLLPIDAILTLPEEAPCTVVRLHHIGKEYTVRDFSPVLMNAIPTIEERP